MGIWGTGPVENDPAADWVESLFQYTGLADHLLETLNGSIEESHQEIRAAAHTVQILSEADIWPTETKVKMRSLAAHRLEQILDSRALTNPALTSQIRKEVGQLTNQPGLSR
jgi:hypothetical protein